MDREQKNCPWCGCGPKTAGRGLWEPLPEEGIEWQCGSHQFGREPWQSVNCELNEANKVKGKLRACAEESREIDQILGRALGYPPNPYGAPGVCTGEHTPVTLAQEAAERLAGLRQLLAFSLSEKSRDDDKLARVLHRKNASLRGRAATIRRMLHEREAARAWLRGEIPGHDPLLGPCLCGWCGAMIQGGLAALREHVLSCGDNPLVARLAGAAAENERLRDWKILAEKMMFLLGQLEGLAVEDYPNLYAASKAVRADCAERLGKEAAVWRRRRSDA